MIRRMVDWGFSCFQVDQLPMWTYYVHMKTVTLRDLRNNFSKLEVWLEEGHEIQIEKRGHPIAILKGLGPHAENRIAKPDFAARRSAIWGERVFSPAEVEALRAAELEGEEG